MKKLITFGDSWVWGVGAGYNINQTRNDYFKDAWNQTVANTYSFRAILSKKYNLENINFSHGGSSNQRQFRFACEAFLCNNWKEAWIEASTCKFEISDNLNYWEEAYNEANKRLDEYGNNETLNTNRWKAQTLHEDDVIVLWGLTSVYRTELFNANKKIYENISLPEKTEISKILSQYHHDEENEVRNLHYQMTLFNNWFEKMNIKNYWFNVFNDHEFKVPVDNLLFGGNSLLSLMINEYDKNDRYHKSQWTDVDFKITKAKKLKLVNPYSLHPTRVGNNMIASFFEKEIDFNTREKP